MTKSSRHETNRMDSNMFVEVIVDVATKSLERPFTYEVPKNLEHLVVVGSVVRMPFGRGNKLKKGYVVNVLAKKPQVEFTLKAIDSVSKEITVESELLELAYFMSKRYLASLQLSLQTMIPKKDIRQLVEIYIKRVADPLIIEGMIQKISGQKRFEKRALVLETIKANDIISQKAIMESTGCDKSMIKRLADKGIVSLIEETRYRNPFELDGETTEKLLPSQEQEQAINQINNSVTTSANKVYLLHGKTGTGKTEVYMQTIETVLKQCKSCIVLIPEIGLTPQTVSRFIKRFGDQVGVMHSKLSDGERYDQWLKAKEGIINIMIGPRSAIFAPFKNIGMIIMDESHETTYKSETNPKYNAREIAIKRAHYHKCPVVLGTATPLVENYYKALQGKYVLLKLNQRFGKEQGPTVHIVDMRAELNNGNMDMFSEDLKTAMAKRIENKEQTILFLNRRGHSNFVSCRNCGHVVKCESCDMPYTYHSTVERLICHHCGQSLKMVTKCPVCESTYIKTFGVGTQQVEKRLMALFPQVKVLRMDFDTTARKGGHEQIINQFKEGHHDVLIGTQMVAKGHHFEKVTLVGVLAADMSLYMDDFRAAEKTFQLLNQVTGRAGRGELAGESYIQTYTPDHKSVLFAKADDYEGFYHDEIQLRSMLSNPPYSTIMKIVIQGAYEKQVIQVANELMTSARAVAIKLKVRLLGPSPASISKVRNKYRWQIIAKAETYGNIQQLAFYINDIKMQYLSDKLITIGIDINPMSV